MNQELKRWLDAATKGLPKETAAMVREELKAHYLDAVAEHQAAGALPSKAHLAAMADLGDVKPTSQGLRETHLARRRYLLAILLSMVYPILLSMTARFPDLFIGDDSQAAFRSFVTYSVIFTAEVSVFFTVHFLMTERFQFDRLARPIKLMASCIVGSAVLSAVTLVLFNKTPLDSSLKWVEVALEFGVGLGLVSTGLRLGQIQDRLWAVLKLLRIIVLIVGSLLVVWALAMLTGNHQVENWSGLLFFFASNFCFIALAFVFVQAAVSRQSRPLQTT